MKEASSLATGLTFRLSVTTHDTFDQCCSRLRFLQINNNSTRNKNNLSLMNEDIYRVESGIRSERFNLSLLGKNSLCENSSQRRYDDLFRKVENC